MAWHTPADAECAALIGARIDVGRTGVRIVAGVTNNDGRREMVA